MKRNKHINLNTVEGRNLFYQSKAWRAVREIILTEQPYCVECLKHGIFTLATEVDHIIDIAKRTDLFLEKTNLQGLCKPCHAKKTFNEHRFTGHKWVTVNKKWRKE